MTPHASAPDGPLTRIQKLFRTTAFKLSIAYLVVFAACAGVALGTIAWSARRVLDDQIVSTIDAEINGLAEQYNGGGLRRLIGAVERRAAEPGASLYLVTTANGDHVVGNVGDLPASVLATPGQAETTYGRSRETQGRETHRAIVRIFTLPGGFRLLVGRDVEERDRLRGVIASTLGTSLAVVVLLGVIGGWVVASRVLKRVDAMTETAGTIMAGDLGRRLPVAGNGDELDRLAQNLNLMLERIGELMRGLREVSDNIAHDLKTPLTRLRNRAVLDGVVDEVGERLPRELAVAVDDQAVRRRDGEVQAALLGQRLVEFADRPHHRPEVDGRHHLAGVAGLQARDHQQGVEDPDQTVAVLDHAVERGAQGVRRA
ncbi:HAMP domain-containing protein, partial [Methylobacterium sp. WL122]